jgi:peptidoglycan/LPS O-acetylase OafA/YrhL
MAVFPIVVAAATVLVAHIAVVDRSAVTRLLALRPLMWVGERSYGVYL